MASRPINLKNKLPGFDEIWSPGVIDEMHVLRKGVEHKPSARGLAKILLIEPRGIVNTGESTGELTAFNTAWIWENR